MATRMAQVPLQKCEICENGDGRRYCIDCDQYFCKRCEQFHLKSKSCIDHVFQNIGQINPDEKKVKCVEHNENMTYYCTTCSVLVCKICLPNSHTKHDFTLTSEAAFKLKTNLKEKIEHMKTVVGSISQQRTKLEEKNNQFVMLTQNLIYDINQKGNELKNAVDEIVCEKVSNVKKEQHKNVQKKTEEERILKDAQERGERVILKVTNAVENQEDTVLLNSQQALQQSVQYMPDIVDSDIDFPTLTFKDGSLNDILLAQMIGSVMISKQAVNRTLQKTHTADGLKLRVKKHSPPKRYPNKALVKGFGSKTTEDGIMNFIEARTKVDVEDVYFGVEKSCGKAIVTFDEQIGGYMCFFCPREAIADLILEHTVLCHNEVGKTFRIRQKPFDEKLVATVFMSLRSFFLDDITT